MKLDAIEFENGKKELALALSNAKKACRLIRNVVTGLLALAIISCAVLTIGMLLEVDKGGHAFSFLLCMYLFMVASLCSCFTS